MCRTEGHANSYGHALESTKARPVGHLSDPSISEGNDIGTLFLDAYSSVFRGVNVFSGGFFCLFVF